MKTASLLVIGTTLALVLALLFFVEPAEAKRRGSSSSRSSSSSSSRSSSSSSSSSSRSSSSSSRRGSSPTSVSSSSSGSKKKVKSKLKKAAVVGAVAYTAYKVGKLKAGFGLKKRKYKFYDWNDWREADGLLCRNTTDCNWVDPRLYCQDYELDFSPSRAWFGGDFASIVGTCACPRGWFFDDKGSRPSMKCSKRSSGLSGTSLILAIVIPLGLLLCCACAGFFIVRKMRN